MSQHAITLQWTRAAHPDDPSDYNRAHSITFKNGQPVGFSAPAAYRGDNDHVDPEEAFVAAIASCHMLTFLAIAAKGGLTVESYRDEAVGHMGQNEQGKNAVARVELRPHIGFSGEAKIDQAALEEMNEKAHHNCFIASSVRTEVTVSPRM